MDIPNISLGETLGKGAFGKVYRARHRVFDIDVAVKLIQSNAVGSSLDAALKEARLMARLDHPNLLRIFDAGHAADGVLYLVVELMDGTCGAMRRVDAVSALDLTRQLLAGIQALHEARVVHRDIKPANCLVRDRDRRIKLADLGIAIEQVTRARETEDDWAGTLPFMAPELFGPAAKFSAISDLYALGITLQCLVISSDPFPRERTELLAWIRTARRPRSPAHVLICRGPSHR